jgi:hypothetical protein
MDEHRSFSAFRDPKLSDRDLLLLVLYEIARLRADVGRLRSVLATTVSVDSDTDTRLAVEADREAFAELEADMQQFERGPQPPPK